MHLKKYLRTAALSLCSAACLFVLCAFTGSQDCQAKGQVRWFESLNSGLAYAKKSKKWVFVDIGAEW